MKEITISRGLIVKVDNEDYERIANIEVNYRSNPLRWQATYCTTDKKRGKFTWYASKTIDYKKWKMHRYIFYLRGIDIEGKEIDHKDGDGLNNQFSNLRVASSSQQKTNRGVRADNKLGYKCVEKNPRGDKYTAYIVNNGKKKSLGSYTTAEEAALAYNKAAIEQWGEYAWTNKVKRPTLDS